MYDLPYKGQTPLLGSAPMSQITRFAAVLAASVALAGAALADPFKVKDLTIDTTSPTSFQEALAQGREQAKVLGAQRLIERLTLPEDRNSAQQPLVASDIARFATSLTTQAQDKRSQTSAGYRVISLVSYSYTPDSVRQYLQSHGVPYVDAQAGKALIVPAVVGGLDPVAWGNQWTEAVTQNGQTTRVGRSDDTVLTPYEASPEAWPRGATWMEVQGEITKARADRAVIAEAYAQGSQIYVRLIDMRTGAADAGNAVGPFSDLPSAKAAAIAEMERAWKLQSIVRTSGATDIAMVATFRDIGEWVKIRRGFEASRLVSRFAVESISAAGADIRFAYNGRPDQLAADLKSRGVDLRGADGGWVAQVLTSQ
jgi:hypothetical protein